MKNVMLMALVGFSLSSSAQISLEHSYSSYKGGTVTIHNLEGEGYKYMISDNANKRVYLFNTDHSLWKTINVQLPNGCKMNGANYASTRLFATDSKVEILVHYIDTTSSKVTTHLQVCDEDGLVIKRITDTNSGYGAVWKVDNNWKLFVNYLTPDVYTDVYSLPGKLLSAQKPGKNNDEAGLYAYPNPAQNSATLSYVLPTAANTGLIQVFSQDGTLVRSYPVNDNAGSISIDRAALPSGIYHCTLKSDAGEAQSQQLIFQ